jgi:hypothetical protein
MPGWIDGLLMGFCRRPKRKHLLYNGGGNGGGGGGGGFGPRAICPRRPILHLADLLPGGHRR